MGGLARYAKAVVALLGSGVTLLLAALQDGTISGTEWIAIITAVLTPLTVGAVRNRPDVRTKASVHDLP